MTCGPSRACSRRRPTRCGAASTTSACVSAEGRARAVTAGAGAFGVYLHVPFCARRCDYCAFATWTDRHHLMAAYADACRRELMAAALPRATSVFVGGGTPSLLAP